MHGAYVGSSGTSVLYIGCMVPMWGVAWRINVNLQRWFWCHKKLQNPRVKFILVKIKNVMRYAIAVPSIQFAETEIKVYITAGNVSVVTWAKDAISEFLKASSKIRMRLEEKDVTYEIRSLWKGRWEQHATRTPAYKFEQEALRHKATVNRDLRCQWTG